VEIARGRVGCDQCFRSKVLQSRMRSLYSELSSSGGAHRAVIGKEAMATLIKTNFGFIIFGRPLHDDAQRGFGQEWGFRASFPGPRTAA
jgi:hypothetical protein